MGLSQSLYTGWTGMATHQRSLDNTGNNLANVNTVGYRKSDFAFSNLFNTVLNSGGYGEGTTHSSVNAKTLGVGTTTGAITHNFTQGPIETTTNPLDVAINGNGFFLADTGYGTALTRNGSFYLSPVGSDSSMLTVGDGYGVQGWNAVNGVITPSTTVSNIVIPAIGSIMTGQATTKVDLDVILPTNTSSSDFNGSATTDLDIKGNLGSGSNTLATTIYASVTSSTNSQTTVRNEVREVQVQISFEGPTLSADGSTNDYAWTMTTVDWPNAGDEPVQIYPPLDDSAFTQGTISFYAAGNIDLKHGAGQAVADEISPGATTTSFTYTDADGNEITTSLSLSNNFSLDVSRLTSLADAPGGNELETWHVNGNPKGTMARTISVFGEYTDFEEATDANGNTVMQAVSRVETRENTLIFEKTASDDTSTSWTWKSAADGGAGVLTFDTQGDLVSSEGGGGRVEYNFDGARYINYDGSVKASDQDGYRTGTLQSLSIDQNGKIFGYYSNGITDPLAQIAMGTVQNTAGLNGSSGTLFYTSSASGELLIGIAGSAGSSGLLTIGNGLTSSALEGSNVDLSREFTDLISIERGYQLNGRVITTSDEMLQTAYNLKR